MSKITIREAHQNDHKEIWGIIKQVIAGGDTYVFPPDSSQEEMINYWCGIDKHTYVTTCEDKVVGTFFIKDNFPGLGSHVANASYMVSPEVTRKGIGIAMGKFSLAEAKKLGYKAIQFNIVVKTNTTAIHLWHKLGFEIKGEIPDAFNHKDKGYVNIYIMWKEL